MSYIEQEKERIVQDLLENNKIKPGQLIDYKYFLVLYEPYKDRMGEVNFAEILEIKYGNYSHIKNEGKRVRVLKGKTEQITEEEKEKIIEELLSENKIKIGQLIDYKYFLELYEPYKTKLKEMDFAQVLGISYGNYMNIKNKKTQSGKRVRTKILENKREEANEQEKEQIIEELLNEGKIKLGQAIDYTYFLELYEPYKNKMKELDFAQVLGITYSNYKHIKNREARARVLKAREEISKEEKERIIQELLGYDKIKSGQLIDYECFLELYEPYKNLMREIDFAEILQISYPNFSNFKKQGRRATILRNYPPKLDKKEKRVIIEELLNENKIEIEQLIDYECFSEMYMKYKGKIRELDFAEILGLTYDSYMSIKNKGKNTTVLKHRQKKLSDEEKEEIVASLLASKKIKPGHIINYEQFLSLYEAYRDKMNKVEFARILGINYGNYMGLKNKGTNAIIRDYREKEKIDRIKHRLKQEARYYSKEEIESLAKEYEIDVKRMIEHIFYLGKERDVSDYVTLLEEKEKVWIGKIKCSKKFANTHAESIIRYAEEISKRTCFKYKCQNIAKDVAGNAIVYILEDCGDIDKNFNDKKNVAKELIKARIALFAKYKCLENLSSKEYSMEVRYTNSKGEKETFHRVIKDETKNVEKEVLEKIQEETENKNIEEKCIQILMRNVEEGLSREEALSRTGEMLDIKPEEMLEILQGYMIKQNKVRQTQKGEYILKE